MIPPFKRELCSECGADSFKTLDYDKKVSEELELRNRFKKALAQHGLARAEWTIREIELVEGTKYLQRKTRKQSEAINRLEEKLRKLGSQPYKEDRSSVGESNFDNTRWITS